MSTENSRIWALDLDQTMLDTNKIFTETALLARELGITGGDDLHGARRELEATGGSFDTDGFLIRAGASEEERGALWEEVGRNKGGKEFLFPDTAEFLDTLDELNEPYFTLTYGSLQTQLPKLRATALDTLPYLITDKKKKGELIDSWQSTDGYTVTATNGEVFAGSAAYLVDDKAPSFDGLPEDSAGYLVQRQAPKPSQRGEVPPRIQKVANLATITAVLRKEALAL